MLLHPYQKKIASSLARFKVIRAGRKGGKTLYERESISFKATASVKRLSLSKNKFDTGRKVIYIAPTQSQARNIIWESLKNRFAKIGTPNEQMLQMKVPNEDNDFTTIYVGGWENRENYRGLTDVIHITFDETDTLRDFFTAWKDIFRPMFLDTAGSADFIGTPKKENPNLRRLEKEAKGQLVWECFHFTSKDNPYLDRKELEDLEEDYKNDRNSYRQEILAEHIDNTGALFQFNALTDLFTNTIDKTSSKFMTVDVAGEGNDKTIFTIWEGLEATNTEVFSGLLDNEIVSKTKEYASLYKIPYSNIAIDGIGEGSGVATSPLLNGIVIYKSSYSAIKSDLDPVRLPNVHYTKSAPLTTEYKNLRSQCVFTLADKVNSRKIAIKIKDTSIQEQIIEELSTYQDVSKGDGKRMATKKDEIKAMIGRSPDISDTLIMRMYFVIRDRISPTSSQDEIEIKKELDYKFDEAFNKQHLNSTR